MNWINFDENCMTTLNIFLLVYSFSNELINVGSIAPVPSKIAYPQIFFQILLHLSCLFFPLSRCRIRTNPLPPDEGKCVNHRTHGRLHVCCKKFAKNRYKKTFNKRTDDILQQLYFEGDETTKSVLAVYFPKPTYFFATLLRAKLYQMYAFLQHIKRPSEVNNLAHQNT